jgi:transposase
LTHRQRVAAIYAIVAEDFNDDGLGRSLYKIQSYGVTKLYSDVALQVGLKFDLLEHSHHLDTTSLTVYGEYPEKVAASDDSKLVKSNYGHAKNKRFDLKQMILLLATTGKSNFPLWMEAYSGNTSDKVSLQEATERMQRFFKG